MPKEYYQKAGMVYYEVANAPAILLECWDAAVRRISEEEVAQGRVRVSQTAAFGAFLRGLDIQETVETGLLCTAPQGPRSNRGFQIPKELKAEVLAVATRKKILTGAVGRLCLLGEADSLPEAIRRGLAVKVTAEENGAAVVAPVT